MELTKANTSDALVINGISKRAFDGDITVGAASKAGPPGYMSVGFHIKMAKANDGLIVGDAILFADGWKLNIGRIFMMQEIERIYQNWAVLSIRKTMNSFIIGKR